MRTYLSSFLILLSISLFAQQKAEDPVAVDDSVTMMQYGTVHINVLANDYDPADLTIFIDEVDEEEGFEISFQDSIVSITALEYYDGKYISIDYRIENEAGEKDRADINIYYIENPDVPVPIRDIFDLQCQKSQIINLTENDSYTGSDDLIVVDINSNYQNVELLSDQQSVKFTAGLYSGKFDFSYRIKETAGNNYTSKKMRNFVYVRKNQEVPVAYPDTLEIAMGENKHFDILANDESINQLILDSVGLPDYASVENNLLVINCPDSIASDLKLDYQAFDELNLYKTLPTDVIINVTNRYHTPIAVLDSLEYDFKDTVLVRPLDNDINNYNTPLVISPNGNSVFRIYYSEPSISFFNRWEERNYSCKNLNTNLISEIQTCYYRIKAPDSIHIEEEIFHIKMGETLTFTPRNYTNLPDSISFSAGLSEHLGELTIVSDELTYTPKIENLPGFYMESFNGLLEETIVCRYNFEYNGLPQFIMQYFKVKIDIAQNASTLDVNNFAIPVFPFGMTFNSELKPSHNGINADNFLEQIRPWVANEYDGNGDIQFSGDIYETYGFRFINGPIADDYTGEYSTKYFRTWAITKEEIDNHRNRFNDPDYNMPEVILNWPAGKISYQGIDYEQADFVDVNENGIYDPELGDFPKISGDKAILYIINDGRFGGGYYSGVDSLNVDIYVLVYAFNRPESELFQNTFFMKYKVINKSNIDYSDFRFAQIVLHDNYNLGNHMGCDTILNTFYSYPVRGNLNQFFGATTFLDNHMGKFLTYGDVDSYPRYRYANMMGLYNDEFLIFHAPLWMYWAPLDYVFPSKVDDPYGANAFSFDENNYGLQSGSGDGLGSSDAIELLAGDQQYFELAYSVYFNDHDGLFELVENGLNQVSQLHECYQNDSVPGGGSFTGIHEVSNNSNTELLVYPNPAKTLLYVEGVSTASEYSIYTLQGQRIEGNRLENEISIEHLSEGFYLLQIRSLDGKQEWTSKFVKQ